MKQIVFINQNSGYLMIDIVNAYAQAGYNCVLITGRLIKRDSQLNPEARTDRIIKYNRTTTFKRLLTWGIGFLQIWLKIIIKYHKDSLFIVSNPPFATLLPLFVKNPFQLLIFDIYPDVLTELGYLSVNSHLMKWWRKANKKVYFRARRIFTITNSMRQVLQKYANDVTVEVVPIWTSNTFLKPVKPSENPFLKKLKLTEKFIVLYSGNLGLSGDVDVLVDIAGEIKREDIIFMVIGDGAKKQMIHEKAKKLDLKNFILLPWQPVDNLPYSLSSASLAVITLGTKASRLAIPSKIYNFFSVGAPLLCITTKGSEVENLVNKYECGRSFEPADISGMVNFIVEVADSKELQSLMKENSLKASEDFSISNVKKFLTPVSYD